MVFQNYALYPHMNVYNNLAYGLKNRGIDKQSIEQKVNDAAKLLQISFDKSVEQSSIIIISIFE